MESTSGENKRKKRALERLENCVYPRLVNVVSEGWMEGNCERMYDPGERAGRRRIERNPTVLGAIRLLRRCNQMYCLWLLVQPAWLKVPEVVMMASFRRSFGKSNVVSLTSLSGCIHCSV